MSTKKTFPSDVWIACDLLHDIEWEEVKRFARNQYLTDEERKLRDTLLGLVASDFPLVAYEYTELNRRLDEAAKRMFDKLCA